MEPATPTAFPKAEPTASMTAKVSRKASPRALGTRTASRRVQPRALPIDWAMPMVPATLTVFPRAGPTASMTARASQMA